MKKISLLVLLMFVLATTSQLLSQSVMTTYAELQEKIQLLDQSSDLLNNELIGTTTQGRNVAAMKFSKTVFGTDASKIKVLIFAQQHGNEQSGKEAALLLADWLLQTENSDLLDKMDVALIPQMNPDGSEINQRRNANGADLNRNHLVLSEPETQALHRFFDKYLFEVTLDVHEYSPYGEAWQQYGYRKNTAVALGNCTNPNVVAALRTFSEQEVLPFIMNRLNGMDYSSFVYCPGGPPDQDYFRHSTFDINDGRQSFGIQQSLSFIQEGMNGLDTFEENLPFRAQSQMEGMKSLLLFVAQNKEIIRRTVANERAQLLQPQPGLRVSLQAKHIGNGSILALPLFSYRTSHDTVVMVEDYRPVVQSFTDVEQPLGYLIPKNQPALLDWAERQALPHENFTLRNDLHIEQYYVHNIDSIDFEDELVADAIVERRAISPDFKADDYVFYPCNHLKGKMMVMALEPKSMLGLVTYPDFRSLLKAETFYPVLRVVGKKK